MIRSRGFWLLALALVLAAPAFARNMAVSVLDVGQGDSILVQLPSGGAVLVDAGTREAGPTVVSDLRGRGIKSLDMVVATHPHADHIGGMEAVLKAFPVRRFLDSGFAHGSRTQIRLLKLIERQKIPYKVARAGQMISLGGAKFQILAPKDPLLTGTDSDENSNSIVIKVTDGAVSFLLTGDMEQEERMRLMATRANLSATVLKVAHHGSRNGTDTAFVTRVKPKVAVISVAAVNDYGHPHAEALEALSKVKLYRTDRDGTVTITTDGKTYKVSTSPNGSR